MALATRIKWLILLFAVIFYEHSNAEFQGLEQQVSKIDYYPQGEMKPNFPDVDNSQAILGLLPVIRNDWEIQNKPYSEDELYSVVKDLVKSVNTMKHDFTIHNPIDVNLNDINYDYRKNVQTNEDQNDKNTWQEIQTSISDRGYIETQTIFPIKSFGSDFWPGIKGTVPKTTTYRPEPSDTSSPDPVTITFNTMNSADVLTTTTPKYWYNSQDNLYSASTGSSINSDVNPTKPTILLPTHEDSSPTIPILIPEVPAGVKINISSFNSTYRNSSSVNNSDNSSIAPAEDNGSPTDRPKDTNLNTSSFQPDNDNQISSTSKPFFNIHRRKCCNVKRGRHYSPRPSTFHRGPLFYSHHPWNRPRYTYQNYHHPGRRGHNWSNYRSDYGQHFNMRPRFNGQRHPGSWNWPSHRYQGYRHHHDVRRPFGLILGG